MTELHSNVLIIGAGFGGIAAGIRLLDKFNSTDFHIYEKSDGFGGTWWANRYPGCAVDIPAFLYSISTDPYKDWTTFFPRQPEILDYITKLVEKRGLKNYATFNSSVIKLNWDIEKEEWIATVKLSDDSLITHRAKLVLSGRGGLVNQIYPSIPGLEVDIQHRKFKGIYEHSSKWDPNISLKDKDVIVIGNGCTGTQIVPAIVDDAKSVSHFIRSKHWLVPQPQFNKPLVMRWIINNIIGTSVARFLLFLYLEAGFPIYNNDGIWANMLRGFDTYLAKVHVRKNAPKEYVDLLIPDFEFGCKRRVFENGYLKSLNSDKVVLTDDPIVSVSEDTVHTGSGKTYHADVIIAATGFSYSESAQNITIFGINKKESLNEYWDRTVISAYNTSQIPNFPNFFYVSSGPNSYTGHSSCIIQIENTLTYIEKVAGYVIKGSASSVDVKPEAYETWKNILKEKSSKSVFIKGGCVSYSLKDGKNIMQYPWNQFVFWWRSVHPKYGHQIYHWKNNENQKAKQQKEQRNRTIFVWFSTILGFITALFFFKH